MPQRQDAAAAMRIDPWSSQQSTDYQRLREEFGIAPFDFVERLESLASDRGLPQPPPLVRRGIIFGHRGFESVLRAIERGDPWGVLTGLMPSGPMHFGHKMVIDQVKYYQSLGADITITVADIEAYATRGFSLEKCREIAMRNYIENYFALGLKDDNLRIYFQSENEQVKDLAWKLGKRVNFSTMQAIYGFGGETNMGHAFAPLVQVGDILHVQLPQHGGPRPVVVPVGVDQDPHIRLTRDLAAASRIYAVQPHTDPKLGEVVGVFLKESDEKDVDRLLQKAKSAIEKEGFADVKLHPAYRALYVLATTPADVPPIDAALARIEPELGGFGFLAPAATYHRFMSGLTGGKMSSSKPETHIALDDAPAVAAKKMMGAQTGGRATAEEQRRLGAEPDKCMVYETYVYHLVPEDDELALIHKVCSGGEILCGECKNRWAKPNVTAFAEWLGVERERTKGLAEEVVTRSRRK
ncbi:MAG: tryptophan--tRNA ligase [Thermoplasmatota archaeon]